MRWRKSKEPTRSSSDLTAFIDEGSEIEGKYTFHGTVMLNGKFSGEINSSDSLIIGEKGVVNATVRAGVVLINGEVIGNVFATERVELRGTARVWALDAGARRRFAELERGWKRRARSPEENATTSAALLKADRQLLRLALVVAELNDPGGGRGGLTVTAGMLDSVAPLLEFCLDGWRALPSASALALSQRDAVLNEGVDKLLAWLEERGGEATPREILRTHVAGVRTTADLTQLLRRYEDTYPGTVVANRPPGAGSGRPGRPGRTVRAPRRAEYVAKSRPPTHTPGQAVLQRFARLDPVA